MSFAQNLIYIRQHYGVTQETIAEQLGVSRQTVSKWEAGINYPETDKLLELCNLYHTNLDDLMRGSVKIANVKDTEVYDAHMNRFCWGIVGGVALAICGVSACMLLEGTGSAENMSAAAMFSFMVVGALITIVAGLNHSEFKRKNANIEPSYPDEVLDRFGRRFTVLMASGLGIIMLDFIMFVALSPESGEVVELGGMSFSENLLLAPFMLFIALGVGILIYAGMQKAKYDKSEFMYVTTDGSSALGRGGAASRKVTPEELRRNQVVGVLCGVIMLFATIAFFVIGFSSGGFPFGGTGENGSWPEDGWRENGFAYSWIVFLIGGILCGIVSLVGGIFGKSREEMIAEARKENPWVKVDKGDETPGQ